MWTSTYLRTCWQFLKSKRDCGGLYMRQYSLILKLSNNPPQWQVHISILTLSTQSQHQIPQVIGHSLQDCPHSRCHLKFWVTCTPDRSARNWGSPNPLLRFDNLLERLTELRKTLYLCLLVYYKGYA